MNKPHPFSFILIVRSLDKKIYFKKEKIMKKYFIFEVPYLSDICVLMYLANNMIANMETLVWS